MANWDAADETGTCSQDVDRDFAKLVCRRLDIPLVEVNFVKEYWNEVFRFALDISSLIYHKYKVCV